jgi:branched-chain amino acid transport system substrate-binding protein
MTRKRHVLTVLTAIAAVLIAGCSSSSSSSSGQATSSSQGAGPINIGLIAGLTGPSSAWSVPYKDGAELAVQDINAHGGINGRKVVLYTEDNQSSPETSITNVTTLMFSDHVNFIVCSCDSGQFLPIVARLAQADSGKPGGGQFVVSNGVAGTTQILQLPPVYISAFPLNGTLAATLAAQAWKMGYRRAYVLSQSDAYGQDMYTQLQAAWKNLGGTVVGATIVNPSLPNYTSVMQQVNNANPQVIFTGTYGPDALLQFREITQMGNKAPWFLLFHETAAFNSVAGSTNRAYGLDPAWLASSDPTWVAHYTAVYHHAPGLFDAQGYDTTWLAAQAVAHAGSSPTVDSIKSAYMQAAQSYSGPTGKFVLNSQYARIDAPVSWFVVQNGQWVALSGTP